MAEHKISTYNKEELKDILKKLCRYEWDERLGKKPEGFDDLPTYNHHWYHHLFKRKTKDNYIRRHFFNIEHLIRYKEEKENEEMQIYLASLKQPKQTNL